MSCAYSSLFKNADSSSEMRVEYHLEGPGDGKLCVVLGGISADCYPSKDPSGRSGWWSWLVGQDKTVDTRRYRVLSFNFFWGNRKNNILRLKSQNIISTTDQARILSEILNSLHLEKVDIFIGASYGGMVGLAFAALYPERIRKLLVLCAAHKSSPYSIGLRTLQREILENFYHSNPKQGVVLARSLAMLTYRTPDDINKRFDGSLTKGDDPDSFPVWNYLNYKGAQYSENIDPVLYYNLSRSIDHHHVDPSKIECPLNLIAINQDLLVPVSLCEELVSQVSGPSHLVRLDSLFGHDAFLKEEHKVSTTIQSMMRRT